MVKGQNSRGRPKLSAEEAQQKKTTVIEVAQKLFYQSGYEAVSMRKIAQEAGMGTMTIYKYFNSKSEILHHIWHDFFLELLDELEQSLVNSPADPRSQLERLCRSFLEYWLKHPERFRMVYLNEDRAENHDDFFVSQSGIDKRLIEIIFPVLSSAFPNKDNVQLIEAGELIISTLHGIALNLVTISEYPWNSHETLLKNFMDFILPTS